MNTPAEQISYYVGWDVGGWNCDKNRLSRDALVILDKSLQIVGTPWRGNLATYINSAADTRDCLHRLFALCRAEWSGGSMVLAIDSPLGFSLDFQKLITLGQWTGPIGTSSSNPYLFRQTERYLAKRGLSPLSAVKDMIGSQATKAMHALARFAPDGADCGVWTNGDALTAIEAYPAACKQSRLVASLRARCSPAKVWNDDRDDALTCALVAFLYASQRHALVQPDLSVPKSEGWIWVPKDGLPSGDETEQEKEDKS